MTEDNRAMFNAEIERFKWPLTAGGISDVLNLTLSPHITDGPDYLFCSEGMDVRGLPDMTIQAYIADAQDEASYKIHFEGSLDGVYWTPLPDDEFIPDISTLTLDTVACLVSIWLKLNWIRMIVYTLSGPPYDPTIIVGNIISGEV